MFQRKANTAVECFRKCTVLVSSGIMLETMISMENANKIIILNDFDDFFKFITGIPINISAMYVKSSNTYTRKIEAID